MSKSVDVMQDVIKDAIEEIEKAAENSDGISGVPTGFYALDKVTAGWQKSDMIVIAARPAMGENSFRSVHGKKYSRRSQPRCRSIFS